MRSKGGLPLTRNQRDVLEIFIRFRVRYLVVGGLAVVRYTEPRSTKDLDLWVDPEPRNAKKVFRALAEFGADLAARSYKDFTERYQFFQIGVAYGQRVDVLMSIAGVRFSSAWKNRNKVNVYGMRVNFISKGDLIKAKRAVGRPQDVADLANLLGET